VREPEILQLEGGDHDPHKRGFTLSGAELFLSGAVDPYIDAAGNITYFINPEGDTVVELEEAYMTTRSLPHNLQVKAGQFFTEFGRNNPQHPHQWLWIDQPIINTRVFGPDGMRGPGMRVSYLMPTEHYSEVFAVTCLLGLGVGLSIRCAGMLYTFGVLVLPALVAKNVCREVRPMFVIAPAISLGTALVGFILANYYDFPPAQMVVALLGLLLPASWPVRKWRAGLG
jgi:hypothetical protein